MNVKSQQIGYVEMREKSILMMTVPKLEELHRTMIRNSLAAFELFVMMQLTDVEAVYFGKCKILASYYPETKKLLYAKIMFEEFENFPTLLASIPQCQGRIVKH